MWGSVGRAPTHMPTAAAALLAVCRFTSPWTVASAAGKPASISTVLRSLLALRAKSGAGAC